MFHKKKRKIIARSTASPPPITNQLSISMFLGFCLRVVSNDHCQNWIINLDCLGRWSSFAYNVRPNKGHLIDTRTKRWVCCTYSVFKILGITAEWFVNAQEIGARDGLGMGQDCNWIFDGVVDNVLDLQFVLVIGVRVGQSSKLLRQLETVGHIFRRDEIFGHFDATVQIANLKQSPVNWLQSSRSIDKRRVSYLMRGTGWNENRIAQTLHDTVARNAVLLVKSCSQRTVQIPTLIVNWIVMRLQTLAAFYGDLQHKQQ